MTTSLERASQATAPGMFNPFRSFFGGSPLAHFLSEPSWPQSNLMGSRRGAEGELILEYNLAGFKPEEIEVTFDTTEGDLRVKATSESSKREFATVLSLPTYLGAEDVATTYEHGVLTITLAPLEKRKEEALVSIPLNSKNKIAK